MTGVLIFADVAGARDVSCWLSWHRATQGHVDPSMAAHYVEEIKDEPLQRIVDHVRVWLFPPAEMKPKGGRPALRIMPVSE